MEISQIKQRLTLKEVLHYYGLKPDKYLRLHCPFHDDKTPSMQVYYKTQSCHCFSTNCKTHGKSLDVIDFIMHKDNVTKHEAILKAKEILGILPMKKKGEPKEDLLELFYRFKTHFSKNKTASEYVKSRHLDKSKLEIGYNPQNSKYPHLKNCIVFPLKNCHGQTVSFYGRSVAPTGNKSKHYYLSGRSGLYPNYPRTNTERLILTEAIIDCATLQSHLNLTSEYSILSLFGTNGLTSEHTEAVSQLSHLKEIILFFDADHGGRGANKKYSKLFKDMPYRQAGANS